MRILGVFSTSQVLGGGEVSFALSLKGLQGAGCEVLALLPDRGALYDHLSSIGIRCQIAPQPPFRRGGSVQFLLRPHPVWIDVARAFGPDVIHCNAIRSALYGQAVGRTLSIPVVFHARTAQKDPPFDQFLTAATSAIVCTSRTVKERFPSWFGAEKLTVIPNATDPAFFQSGKGTESELRQAWLGGGAGLLIGVVGRLSPAKGQQLIVDIAPKILAKYPSCRFVFVGDEDPSCQGQLAELKQRLLVNGSNGAVVFAGFQVDMRSVYRALDIIAFPTLTEGFGRIVIEAGAASKPIVASDLPALREIVPNAIRDYLLATPPEFASKLIHLVGDAALRNSLAEQLHSHVLANYSLGGHVGKLMSLYRTLTTRETT